ncbi:eukaryotic translation initiation factor 4 gamma 3-like [Salarias fasciatus]|uniref:eukaryotic translation initiation factor 4 gamma 3-like n=1 Tax=Salarias fasciatus TaxID=181472 RepID=UPI0011767191|nr:eukaryotic translation initiation factor 4 gamma 3-like [Salarias fasciatus]
MVIRFNNGELTKCQNAWKPTMKRSMPETDPEKLKTEDLLRKVRAILNKLTLERFSQLVEQLLGLSIDSTERLTGIMDLVFEKAIDEPSFSVMYGQLCHRLAPTAERERREELELEKNKARRRSVGLVKLIGELFKLKMTTAAFIFDCVHKLLKTQEENSLQCVCVLLTTVGKQLDVEEAKPQMDHIFSSIMKLVNERRTTSRIRFLLQDVIELKDNNWVPGRADQGPKTILQVHEEAEMEEQEEHRKVNQQLLSEDGRRRAGPFDTPRFLREESRISATGKNPTRSFLPRDTARVSKPQLDQKIQLRPQGQGSWAQGCAGRSRAGNSAVEPVASTPTRPALSADQAERKSRSIVEEFLHLKDFKEAVECVEELHLDQQLHIFVGVELTLEWSQSSREEMGQLLSQLLQRGTLPKMQFCKGLSDTLELAEDMAIDIPHIWLYLAQLLRPAPSKGGFSMAQLFSELNKALHPAGGAGLLISQILHVLCKEKASWAVTHRSVASVWRESGLSWPDFIAEGEDVQVFISQQCSAGPAPAGIGPLGPSTVGAGGPGGGLPLPTAGPVCGCLPGVIAGIWDSRRFSGP